MTILVMNDVCINHPYLPANVIGGAPAANECVRKVVSSSFALKDQLQEGSI